MQLLIDTATETPRSVRLGMAILSLIASDMEKSYDPAEQAELYAAAAGSAAQAELAAQRQRSPLHPVPPAIRPSTVPPAEAPPLPPGNVPPAPIEHPPVHPDALPDPATLFGGNVPAGTPAVNPTPPAAAGLPAAAAVGATPAAPVTPLATGALVAGGEQDSAGTAWDARIHSDTRKKNADGTWRYRRNLDATVKALVVAELKGQQSLVAPPVSVPQPPVVLPGGLPVPPAPASMSGAPPAPTPVPPAPSAASGSSDIPAPPAPVSLPQPSNVLQFTGGPTAVPVPPAPSVGVPNAPQQNMVPPVTSFRDLMQKMNRALQEGRLSPAQMTDACAEAGGVTALASQPMLVPSVDAKINAYLGLVTAAAG